MKHGAMNSANMKSDNLRLILTLIRRKSVSRADLARLTGLTRAAVTILVDELLDKGYLLETGTAAAGFGRKPILLDLNPRRFYAAGVSISREGCHIGLVDFKGTPVARETFMLNRYPTAAAALAPLEKAVQTLLDANAVPRESLLGIGICTPGPVDIATGTILNPPNFPLWHQVEIARAFSEYFHVDALLENNAAALALAEKNYGQGPSFKSFLLLVIDSGIGAGMIIDRQLYRGVGGFGSEIGHTTLDVNGPACSCGNRGCLELYASMPALYQYLRDNEVSVKSWHEVVDQAEAGNGICRAAIARQARYLAAGIVNAMNLLELEAVILTGDINDRPDMLLGDIRQYAGQAAMTRNIHQLQILPSKIGPEYDILSAAAIVIEKFFTSGGI
ncbi:MAG: ROK family transcriptional regulator [Clostridiaceae bacterium]|nr:ROK family transcriptional regulator [Clostridiaceae bacterium]